MVGKDGEDDSVERAGSDIERVDSGGSTCAARDGAGDATVAVPENASGEKRAGPRTWDGPGPDVDAGGRDDGDDGDANPAFGVGEDQLEVIGGVDAGAVATCGEAGGGGGGGGGGRGGRGGAGRGGGGGFRAVVGNEVSAVENVDGAVDGSGTRVSLCGSGRLLSSGLFSFPEFLGLSPSWP